MTHFTHPTLPKHLGNRPLGKAGLALGLLACSMLFESCTFEDPSPNADNNVTAEEVATQTDLVEGQTVTLRKEVAQTVNEVSFLLDNDGEQVLVINVSGQPFLLPEDEDIAVQATGEVQEFVLTNIVQEYGLDLEPDLYAAYESKPALLAQSLALAPDPGEVTQNPERYYNLPIAIEGEVEDVLDGNSLTLDEEQLFGASDLLVVGTPTPKSLDGLTVTVTGKLRPFVLSELEKDYDLTWDLALKEKIEAEYTTQPVFVADAIYPYAQ